MTHPELRRWTRKVGQLGGWVLSPGLVIGCADKGNNGSGGGGGGDNADTFDYAGCEAALTAMRDCYLENTTDLTEEQLEVFYLEDSACEDEESRFRSTWSTSDAYSCIVDVYDGLDCTDAHNVGASEACY
jgi:hypothetical protein